MDVPNRMHRHGHSLLQAGSVLFFLGLLVGLGVPAFAVPRLALSAHLLAVMQGTFLLAVGLIWPRLRLTLHLSRIGSGLFIYGCFAAWMANLCGAFWGAGSSMLPMASEGMRGSVFQEGTIRVLLMSAAVSLLTAALLVMWGLRTPARVELGK